MYFLRCLEGNAMKFAQTSIPFPVDGKGSKGMGPDLLKQNYEDIGNISMRARDYLYALAGSTKFPLSVARSQSARGDRAQHFPTFGKD